MREGGSRLPAGREEVTPRAEVQMLAITVSTTPSHLLDNERIGSSTGTHVLLQLPQPIPYRPGSSGGSFQATSLDSDNLSLVLDDSCNKLKRDVLVCFPCSSPHLQSPTASYCLSYLPRRQEFFLAARRQMMDHEASAVERERREWTRTLQAKQVGGYWILELLAGARLLLLFLTLAMPHAT